MVPDIVLSDELAREIGVLPNIVLAWANEYRSRSHAGVMMVTDRGQRRCLLSLAATIGMLAMAMPAPRRGKTRWVDLMAAACTRLQDIEALREPVTDPAVTLLSATLKLAEREGMRSP